MLLKRLGWDGAAGIIILFICGAAYYESLSFRPQAAGWPRIVILVTVILTLLLIGSRILRGEDAP